MNRAITLLNDVHAPYKIGLSAMELESWGIFAYIRKIFLTVVIDPSMVYKKISEYNPLFNNTKDFHLLSTSDTHCVFKVAFHDDVRPIDDYHSDSYIQGLLASIPQIWNLPSSHVVSLTNEYDVVELLTKLGGISKHDVVLTDTDLLVLGESIGKRIASYNNDSSWEKLMRDTHTIHDEAVFKHLRESNKQSGIIITKDFSPAPHIALKRGEIYNAPHFTYHISWTRPPFSKTMKHVFVDKWRSRRTYEDAIVASLATIKGYTETLEQKVIERTHDLEIARKESEYWRKKADELLATMLPQHIAKQMIERELESQEIYGTVLYTDIVGFTEYSKNIDQGLVDQELKLYFAEITNIVTRHGGWVNKFLGDGMLVIFGLSKESASTHDALEAGKEILKTIEKYSWGTRISVTTGPFTIGEYGNGELRRFDCIGHTLNLGSRLQSYADKNQIIVCEKAYKDLRKEETAHRFGPVQNLSIKGIGNVDAYTLLVD
jgi:class 3 adenylate cyclase